MYRRVRIAGACGMCVLAAAAACSSFDGSSTEPGDADAAPDAAQAETSTLPDVTESPPQPLPGDAGCKRFVGAAFCSDFDDDSGVGQAPWTSFGTSIGSFVYDDDAGAALSPPRSAVVQFPAGDYQAGGGLTKSAVAAAFGTLTCTFAARVDQYGDGSFQIGQISAANAAGEYVDAVVTFRPGNHTLGRFFHPSDGGSSVNGGGDAPNPFMTAPLAWHTVTMTFDATNVTLAYDDGSIAASTQHLLSPPFTKADLLIGARELSNARTVGWAVRFDDVRCFTTPP